jgi:hypothetical protein
MTRADIPFRAAVPLSPPFGVPDLARETRHASMDCLPSGMMAPRDCELAVFRLATSKETFCPSLRLDIPARSTALMWHPGCRLPAG